MQCFSQFLILGPFQHVFHEVKQLIKHGQWHDAMCVYARKPDAYAATALVSHASKHLRDLPLVLSVYDTLKQSQQMPDCFLYSALLAACQQLGGNAHIGSLWKDMQQYRYLSLSLSLSFSLSLSLSLYYYRWRS